MRVSPLLLTVLTFSLLPSGGNAEDGGNVSKSRIAEQNSAQRIPGCVIPVLAKRRATGL
jgi:hypothetical protein